MLCVWNTLGDKQDIKVNLTKYNIKDIKDISYF